jgi:hypothetical protein
MVSYIVTLSVEHVESVSLLAAAGVAIAELVIVQAGLRHSH